jgi:hypothetical protein
MLVEGLKGQSKFQMFSNSPHMHGHLEGGGRNLLMDENKCKINPTNRMKFLIVAS